MTPGKSSILSGIRPTGPLHVGHLLGALTNWVALQDKYDCHFMIADWHALTTNYADTSNIAEYCRENTACLLAAGLDPARCVIFKQSDVPEHAELHVLLSMITPVPWLERVPSYKEMQEQLTNRDLTTYGFLGYPVLQAADILIYKASFVPVGEDQVAHLELTREIARRFNHLYGEVFPEPQPLLTSTPRLPGADRRKMSKSYGNSIELGLNKDQVAAKVKEMYTDPLKLRMGDAGHPDDCVVFAFHKAFNASALPEVERTCRDGSRGCSICKKEMLDHMWERMRPVQEKRAALLADPAKLDAILQEGAERARTVAKKSIQEVRTALKLVSP